MERGEVLADRYELVQRLGRGGMGEVWAARDRTLHRDVALKLLDIDGAENPEFVRRFEREAVAGAQITHPNVAGLYDRGTHEHMMFLVMEKVDGTTLTQHIQAESAISTERALRIAAEICLALRAAHEARVIHYDIKPHNVMLTRDDRVKVVDFGIAGFIQATFSMAHSSQFTPAGTAEYGAPEQFLNERGDERSDLYALGGVLFAMLTRRPPFTGHNVIAVVRRKLDEDAPRLETLRPDLPYELTGLVADLLHRDPARRPQSAEAVHERLEHLRTDLRATGGGPSRPAPVPAPAPPAPAPRPQLAPPYPAAPPATVRADRPPYPADAPAPRLFRRRNVLAGLGGCVALAGAGAAADLLLKGIGTPAGAARAITVKLRAVIGKGAESVAFSPDGSTLAITGADIYLCDARTGRITVTLRNPPDISADAFSVAFSSDGQGLATGSLDGSVRLWAVVSGKTVATLPGGHKSNDASVAFSPDQKLLAVAASGSGGGVLLRDVTTQKVVATLTGGKSVWGAAFSPDGTTLATGGDTVRTWDVATRKGKAVFANSGFVSSVVFSPDGTSLAAGTSSAVSPGRAWVWDVATGKPKFTHTQRDEILSVAFSPDGKLLATGSTAQLLDAATGKKLVTITSGNTVRSVAFSPDGKTLATAELENTRLWSLS